MKAKIFPSALFLILMVPTSGLAAGENFWKKTYKPEYPFETLDAAKKRFDERAKAAQEFPSIKTIDPYLRSGILISDIACDTWLNTLGRSERDTNISKSLTNIFVNLIMGFSGINGASPSSLAKGSLGLSAYNASIEVFKNEVLLGTIADIQEKLQEGRKITAATIKRYPPDNFDDAQGMLLSYHNECSPNAIRALLRTSLGAVKYEPADTTLTEAQQAAKAQKAYAELVKDMSTGNTIVLSDQTLYRLYVSEIAAPNNSEIFFQGAKDQNFIEIQKIFKEKNTEHRTQLLSIIADSKQFPQQFIKDNHNIIQKEKETIQIAAETAEDSKNSILKVSKGNTVGISDSELKTIKEIINTSDSRELSPHQLETLSALAKKAKTKTTTEAKKFSGNLAEFIESKKEELEAKNITKALQDIPTDKSVLQAGADRINDKPISINSVLVPKKD